MAESGSFYVAYSDFDIAVHRVVQNCALATLKTEGGYLNEKAIKTITSAMENVTKNPDWHCIFGQKFSTCLECDRGSLLHFFIGDTAFVLFRCTVGPRL